MHVRVLLIFGDNVICRVCKYIHHIFISAQIIATSQDLTPNGRVAGEHPNEWPSGKSKLVKYYFIWPDICNYILFMIYVVLGDSQSESEYWKWIPWDFLQQITSWKRWMLHPRVAPYERKSLIHVMKIWKLFLLCMGLFVNMDATHTYTYTYITYTFTCVYIISYIT